MEDCTGWDGLRAPQEFKCLIRFMIRTNNIISNTHLGKIRNIFLERRRDRFTYYSSSKSGTRQRGDLRVGKLRCATNKMQNY